MRPEPPGPTASRRAQGCPPSSCRSTVGSPPVCSLASRASSIPNLLPASSPDAERRPTTNTHSIAEPHQLARRCRGLGGGAGCTHPWESPQPWQARAAPRTRLVRYSLRQPASPARRITRTRQRTSDAYVRCSTSSAPHPAGSAQRTTPRWRPVATTQTPRSNTGWSGSGTSRSTRTSLSPRPSASPTGPATSPLNVRPTRSQPDLGSGEPAHVSNMSGRPRR